jgi:hypothetical protein
MNAPEPFGKGEKQTGHSLQASHFLNPVRQRGLMLQQSLNFNRDELFGCTDFY